ASDGVVRLLRIKPRSAAASVGDEEVRALVEQGLHAGVFKRAEMEMVDSVLELDDYPVTELMTPRPKIVFLNLDDPEETNWRKIVTSGHSYFPVYQRTRDQVVGLVSVKSLWAHSAIGVPTSLKNLLVPPLSVSEKMTAIQLLEKFKKTGKHIAIITDEFGAIQGLVTLIDVLEAIVGDLPDHGPSREPPSAHQREDGSWLIDATLPVSEFKEIVKLEDNLPHEDEADFQTLGGFVMTQFGRIPKTGDNFEWRHLRFEVMDMDRHRVDKVLVTVKAVAADDPAEASA
ncbi:MAG: hemolysin family protein, partial [Cephaloticoccus sp.]|nr:hemolysin family protein [Cephaloticoccus sp.]